MLHYLRIAIFGGCYPAVCPVESYPHACPRVILKLPPSGRPPSAGRDVSRRSRGGASAKSPRLRLHSPTVLPFRVFSSEPSPSSGRKCWARSGLVTRSGRAMCLAWHPFSFLPRLTFDGWEVSKVGRARRDLMYSVDTRTENKREAFVCLFIYLFIHLSDFFCFSVPTRVTRKTSESNSGPCYFRIASSASMMISSDRNESSANITSSRLGWWLLCGALINTLASWWQPVGVAHYFAWRVFILI